MFKRKFKRIIGYKRKKRKVCYEIIQYVAFKMIFPRKIISIPIESEDKITLMHKEIPEVEYGFVLPSTIHDMDGCKLIFGVELIQNAVKQNQEQYNELIEECIQRYKKENNVEFAEYNLMEYECLSMERQYKFKTRVYYEPVYL